MGIYEEQQKARKAIKEIIRTAKEISVFDLILNIMESYPISEKMIMEYVALLEKVKMIEINKEKQIIVYKLGDKGFIPTANTGG